MRDYIVLVDGNAESAEISSDGQEAYPTRDGIWAAEMGRCGGRGRWVIAMRVRPPVI